MLYTMPFKRGDRVIFVGYDDGVSDQKRYEPPLFSAGTVTQVTDNPVPGNNVEVKWDDNGHYGWFWYNKQKLRHETKEDEICIWFQD